MRWQQVKYCRSLLCIVGSLFPSSLLTGCYSTSTVRVSYVASVREDTEPLTLSVVYRASQLNHPGSNRLQLTGNPLDVKMYDAPINISIYGGECNLGFALPSPRTWEGPITVADYTGCGWATFQKGAFHFGYDTSKPSHAHD